MGVCEGEVLALEMPKGYAAPAYPSQRSMIRRFQFKLPFLESDNVKKVVDPKDPLNL